MPTGLGDEQLWISATNDNTGTSTAFNDQSGNGNNGTAIGTTVVADTTNGGSYAFEIDGVDDYIDCGNSISPTTGYSASAWVNVTAFPSSSNVGTIIQKGFDGSDEPFSFNFNTPTAIRSYSFNGAIHGITSHSHGMSTGIWYHLATTFDGATWKLFIDGVEVAAVSDSTALSQNSLNTYIGASFITSSVQRFLDAKLDDIRLFYRALSQSEITHLATARGVEGRPFYGLGGEKLWMCPTLDDSASDISGNNNNGTYQGGMATVADTGAGGSQAYNHDNTGREILLPADLGISGTSMSISMWFNNTSNSVGSSADNWFGAYDNTYANSNMRIYQFQGLILVDDRNETPDTFINPYTTLSTTNSWVHVVAVADGSAGEYRFYVDGVLADTVSSGGSDMTVKTTVPWRVGGGGISPSAIGMSDDIRAYGRVLTQDEITHLATSRGIEGGPTPPTSGFYNPFINKTFNPNYTRRIG